MKEQKTKHILMEELKTKHILFKFTELQCPLIDKNKQNCLKEILLKPSMERYFLFEWCLGKLGLTIEQKENLSSIDSKVRSFLNMLSSLGLCTKNDADIIEGTAPLSKQLTFWDLMSCILLENEVIAGNGNESSDSNEEYFEHNKSDYEQSCDYISNVCNSGLLNTLFDRKFELLPAYFQKEISKAKSKENSSLSPENIKKVFSKNICDKENHAAADYSIGEKRFELKKTKDDIIPNEDNLVKQENNISESLNNLQNLTSSSFNSVYIDLKPYLPDVFPKDFVDIGPVFKIAADKLQSALQLKHSSNNIVSADTDLQALSSDISSIKLSSENLSNTKLEEYITILSEMNNEKSASG